MWGSSDETSGLNFCDNSCRMSERPHVRVPERRSLYPRRGSCLRAPRGLHVVDGQVHLLGSPRARVPWSRRGAVASFVDAGLVYADAARLIRLSIPRSKARILHGQPFLQGFRRDARRHRVRAYAGSTRCCSAPLGRTRGALAGG